MVEKDRIISIVQAELDGAAHHIDHTMRVYQNAISISEGDQAVDMNILETATLLHDIGRKKEDDDENVTGLIDHAVIGAEMAGQILRELQYQKNDIAKIQHCIRAHRFRSESQRPATQEAKILFDADKLDLTGAIGIARMFMIAGQFKQAILACVDLGSYSHENLQDGRLDGKVIDMSKHSPVIEFETKIKQLPQRLFTERGRQFAKERIAFMNDFFSKLATETTNNL